MKSFFNKHLTLILGFVGLFLVSTGVSMAAFTYLIKDPGSSSGTETKRSRIDLSKPKTEICPINGAKFTKAERDIWDTRRPTAVVIENHKDARPQSGLSKADIVYEAVAEGGITRFLGIFYCAGVAEEVKMAPIRSARVYFVNLAAGYGSFPIFLHQGAANRLCGDCPGGIKSTSQVAKEVDAYGLLDKLGWRNGQRGNDMDGGYNIGVPIVIRDQYRLSSEPAAWEHSVVASLDAVYNEAKKRGFEFKDSDGVAWNEDFKVWQFSDDKPQTPTASEISFRFWDNWADYDVIWSYDQGTNRYVRKNGGVVHVDQAFEKTPLVAKNVVILFAKEKGPVDSEHHMYYEVVGKGDALVFQNGQIIKATWEKDSATSREVFFDEEGAEISFIRGFH
ncbi:MAG: hypothetical protein UT00_C0023G0009 [Parcubacteria group bacterium GW2011_GWA1_38_7]|nr:MAG: hypothetical protein UT00_C0023G0009 [Parcubacteria group bacterium GW2011_GWA1_38_7]